MEEEIAIRLYEHPEALAKVHHGAFTPTDAKGWDYGIGDSLELEDADGGFLFGTIEKIDEDVYDDPHTDPPSRFKVARMILED
ncbi:MAG: hypothetical protein AAF586_06290 [Planctomycetota bacterium]